MSRSLMFSLHHLLEGEETVLAEEHEKLSSTIFADTLNHLLYGLKKALSISGTAS
jgi:hypothetical protein